jgi:ATP-binding cassette subfamily B protein
MTEIIEDEDGARPRTLSNLQVFGFVWRGWMSQRARFFVVAGLFLAGVACEVAIPWAVSGLIDVVSAPERVTEAAWRAWAALSGLYVLYYIVRLTGFRFMAPFSARTMQTIVRDGFAQVQRFSSEWHASSFAGSTVRKVTRAMWGFDAVTDAIVLMLAPTAVILVGLSISIGLRWPAAGLLAGGVATAFITLQILMSRFYTRPANLISNRLDTSLTASMADALSSNPVVKSFGAEAREEKRFDALSEDWRKAVIFTWNRFNNVAVISNILMLSLQAGVTGLLVWAWTQGSATAGDVAFAITSFMLMQSYLRNFNENMRNLQRGLDDTLDVAEFMRTPSTSTST